MNLYKKCTAKPSSFLVIDATFASDNFLHFRKNLLENYKKIVMITNDKIRDGKLQYDISGEAAEASALPPGKIDKYEYLTSEEMLCSNKRQIQNKLRFHVLH